MQVVNFVAKGSIEEGMLEILRFKKSLFAGVLDGGATEVFLKGGRLSRFMETVEQATTAIPAAIASEAPEEEPVAPAADEQPEAAADLWTGLLQTGLKLFEQFAGTSKPGTVGPRVERDERTGESFVKMPLPSSQMMKQALIAIQGLLQQLEKS